MKNGEEIGDIASYVARTEQLSDKDKLALAIQLIRDSGIPVRPEVMSYLREALASD